MFFDKILSKSDRNLDLATMNIEVENVHTPFGVKYIHEYDGIGSIVSIFSYLSYSPFRYFACLALELIAVFFLIRTWKCKQFKYKYSPNVWMDHETQNFLFRHFPPLLR